MGNVESAASPQIIKSMRENQNFKKLVQKANMMAIDITIQGDGSIFIQKRNNLSDTNRIPPPQSEEDISIKLKQIASTLGLGEFDTPKSNVSVYNGYQ